MEDTNRSNKGFYRGFDVKLKSQLLKYEFERMSLAYRELENISAKFTVYLGKHIKFLDLSYNDLQNLSFLSEFPDLHTLVLDRNPKLNSGSLPYLPKLEILWLNNCNIVNTYDWLYAVKYNCPDLKHLSMMCNPVGSTCLNGVTFNEEKEYRNEISKILPSLHYFDGVLMSNYEEKGFNKSIKSATNRLKRTWKSLWEFPNQQKTKAIKEQENLHSICQYTS